MKTKVFKDSIGDAPSIITSGGLTAVPTETVYGLACNGLDSSAVDKVYEVKGRPEIKPLSLMVSSIEDIYKYCEDVPSYAISFAKNHWPGPVTLIFKSKDFIPSNVLANGTTVGLRCPDQTLTLSLIENAGVPLAAPSANPSGSVSAKTAEEVLSYFDGQIDAVIDGGPCRLSCESMIIDFSSGAVDVLRKGFLKTNIIGVIGQSGAGKSSVLEYLSSQGAAAIDCDKLYHSLLDSDADLISDIEKDFPDCVIDRRVDRKKLAESVFSNPDKLETLNKVTHSHISCAVIDLIIKFFNENYDTVVIDAVELLSSGLGKLCNTVIGVISDEDKRIDRIMSRDNIDFVSAEKRVKAQKSEKYYIENCDIVLTNNGTYDEFINNCREVLNFGK